jgi:ABC-type branched-subunit amino acid transport system substrate-binding protein
VRRCLTAISIVLAVALIAACSGDRKTTDTGLGSSSTTSASPSSDSSTFGDLKSPCGPGDAKGTTEQGVTDDKITIGYGDDAGFSVLPGLDHELSDAMKAMIAWCNDQGGINGREIEGTYYDAKFTEVVNAMSDACKQVFMLVGQGWANDVAQEETRLGCKLAMVPGFTVAAQVANAPLMVQGVPNPVDVTPGAWASQLAELFPDKVKKASHLFANVAATIDTKDKAQAAGEAFGWKFLGCPQQYSALGEADWRPFAQRLKECGAEVVDFVGTAEPNLLNVLDGAAQLDYRPIWYADANNYVPQLAKANTSGNADNLYVRLAFTPFEEANGNPATKKYIDLVEKSGGDIGLLGVQAASSFLLWATAARQCGSDLTRDCVLANAKKVKKWTAGGLHAETDPGDNLPPECGLLVKLDGTKWVRVAPKKANTFDCDPSYRVKVTGRVVDQAKLDSNRVSTAFQP